MTDTFTPIGDIAAKIRRDTIDQRVDGAKKLTEDQILAKRFPSVNDMGLRDLEGHEIDPVKFKAIRQEFGKTITVDAILDRMLARLGAAYDAYDDTDKQVDTANYDRRRKDRERRERKAARS